MCHNRQLTLGFRAQCRRSRGGAVETVVGHPGLSCCVRRQPLQTGHHDGDGSAGAQVTLEPGRFINMLALV